MRLHQGPYHIYDASRHRRYSRGTQVHFCVFGKHVGGGPCCLEPFPGLSAGNTHFVPNTGLGPHREQSRPDHPSSPGGIGMKGEGVACWTTESPSGLVVCS